MALKEAQPWGGGPGSSEHTEATCQKLPKAVRNQSHLGMTVTPETRAWCGGVTSRHPEPGATALRPLPTSKAQAPYRLFM